MIVFRVTATYLAVKPEKIRYTKELGIILTG
jgi:hypothetical protein